MSDIQKAAGALRASPDLTCVLVKGEAVVASAERGIKPLLGFVKSGADFRGFSAADKIAGRAAGFLYAALGVKAVHALVMSRAAERTLKSLGIEPSCDESVEKIMNREKTGECPMETAVEGIEDTKSAVRILEMKAAGLARDSLGS